MLTKRQLRFLAFQKELILSRTILIGDHASDEDKQLLFNQFLEVYTTGVQQEFSYFHPVAMQPFDVLRTKFKDGVLNISRDRTAQQNAEYELREKNEQLENTISELQRSNESLEQYAYVASHDLLEPLRKMLMYSEIIERRFTDAIGEEGKGVIQKMLDAGKRMDTLIKDLLNYSQLTIKQSAFTITDLSKIEKEVLSDLETLIKEKNAVVNFGPLLPVLGSQSQMRQLFQNLISNSLKFTRPDVLPEINIESKVVKGKNSGIEVKHEDENNFFQLITVSDNGIGFDQANAEKIFQIFHRLNGRNYPGAGVGLSIVRKVIENHRGYIRAEGKDGLGASFLILLPLAD